MKVMRMQLISLWSIDSGRRSGGFTSGDDTPKTPGIELQKRHFKVTGDGNDIAGRPFIVGS